VRAYLASPEVSAEISEAFRRSIGSPNHKTSLWTARVANEVAAIATLIGDKELAVAAFRIHGEQYRFERPWDRLGNPVFQFKKARKWAGLA
jgi:hypothetical protein